MRREIRDQPLDCLAPGATCTGTVTGSCRILDLALDTAQRASPAVALRRARAAGRDESRVDGDYDGADATLFDSLDQGEMTHPGRIATNVGQPFAHQGLLFEPEIGSYQNRARQYDPAKRWFIQRDPLARDLVAGGRDDGLNPYAYLQRNPCARLDPSGRESLVSCSAPCANGTARFFCLRGTTTCCQDNPYSDACESWLQSQAEHPSDVYYCGDGHVDCPGYYGNLCYLKKS